MWVLFAVLSSVQKVNIVSNHIGGFAIPWQRNLKEGGQLWVLVSWEWVSSVFRRKEGTQGGCVLFIIILSFLHIYWIVSCFIFVPSVVSSACLPKPRSSRDSDTHPMYKRIPPAGSAQKCILWFLCCAHLFPLYLAWQLCGKGWFLFGLVFLRT